MLKKEASPFVGSMYKFTAAFMPTTVASPEAYCVPSARLRDPFSAEGLMEPSLPLAVRLAMLIRVWPSALSPILLSMAMVEGISTEREIPVSPGEAFRLVDAPNEVELPTLSEVLLPDVIDRFWVSPLSGAVTEPDGVTSCALAVPTIRNGLMAASWKNVLRGCMVLGRLSTFENGA